MRKAAILILLAAVALVGCVSEEELSAQDALRCKSFGFQPGTRDFANCRMKLYTARTRPPPVIHEPIFPPTREVIIVPEKK